jgi:hypothetical protein
MKTDHLNKKKKYPTSTERFQLSPKVNSTAENKNGVQNCHKMDGQEKSTAWIHNPDLRVD